MCAKYPQRVRFAVLLGLAASLVFHPAANAQTQATSASLTGVVHDATQAAVAGAKVTLASPETGVVRTFNTDVQGRYSFSLLPPSTYTLTVEASGFAAQKQQNIVLGAGQSASQDVTLNLSTVNTAITVSSESPILTTDNANVAADITEQQLTQLPVNLRNVFGFVALNSSVNNATQFQTVNGGGSQGTADQDISFFNFGGGFFGTSAFLLDGHWDAAGDWGGVIYVPSVEAVQEFKIQTNGFTAQYGWSTGNVVNVVTKAGTSSLHGVAFEFLRNDKLDANSFFNNRAGIEKTPFRRNQFGIAGGGPVYIPGLYKQRNKTFFYANYEGLRQGTPLSYTVTVPTDAMRNGDFSAIPQQLYDPFSTTKTANGFVRNPFTGNKIPGDRISNVAKQLLQYYPKPTSSALVNNFSAAGSAPVGSNEYGIRVDHNVTDNVRLFGRWSQKFEFKETTAPFYGDNNPAGPGTLNPNNRYDGNFGLTWVINPTTIFSFNGGVNHWVEGNNVQGYPFDVSKLGLPAFINPGSPQFPVVNVAGQAPLGPQNGTGQGGFPRNTGTISADVTKNLGAHSLSAGFMTVTLQYGGGRVAPTTLNFDPAMTEGPDPTQANPNTSGFGFASLLLGAGSGGSAGVAAFPFTSKHFYGGYVQDDWKVNRNLTLNLGLRYDYQSAPVDRFNAQSYFNFSGANPVSQKVGFTVPGYVVYNGNGNRQGLYDPQKTNFSPRIGLAYRFNDKLVLRSGFGIFFVPAYMGSGPNPGYGQSTPWVATLDGYTPANTLDNPFPNGLLPQTGNKLGPLTNVGYSTSAVESSRPTPYVEQWMFGIQYAVTRSDMLDVSYVGNHGVKMLGGLEQNQLDPKYLALGNQLLDQVTNPFFGTITSSGCGLADPTVTRGQLLRPFPEFCGVSNQQTANGFTHYNALQATYTHRWSSGLNILASYTFSKFIDDVAGTNSWANSGFGVPVRNNYDLAAEKSVDANDIPHSVVISYIYEIPVGKGKAYGSTMNAVANAIVGGWQVSGITTFKSGFPLGITDATNNTGSLGGNQRPNVVGDPHVSNPNLDAWFNTAAFAQPAAYTFGNAPRYFSNLRAPGIANFDFGIEKWWNWREMLRLQFRTEAFNVFNHTNLYAPDQVFGDAGFGRITAANPPRDIQMALKLYW